MAGEPFIGGFFELETPQPSSMGLARLWRAEATPWAFANARSAFAALIDVSPDANVWLPAFICKELGEAVPLERRFFYSLDGSLSPDFEVIEAEARSNDIVLAVNFFGRPPASK